MGEPGSTSAATVPDPKASATAFVPEGDFYRWNLPAGSARLELHSDVIHIIEGDLHRKAATERRDEFGGLLFGHSNATTYRIIGFEQCRCQSDGLHRVLALWSNRLLAAAQQQPLPPAGGSLLGFYRIVSLTEELELSRVDRNLTESYFASPGSIALLISYTGSTARVFYKTEHGFRSDLLNFPVSIGSLAVHEVTALPKSHQPVAHLPAFDENEFEYNEVASEPLHENFGRRRFDPRLAVAIVAVLAIVLAVWLLRPAQSDQLSARNESSIELEIQRSTSGLMLTWNPASSEISSAKVGLVTIQDGENQQELPLDKEQLMAGRLFYPPISEMVRFTLQIFTENGVQRDYAAAIVPSNGSKSRSATDQPPFEVPLRSAITRVPVKPAAANQAGTGTPKAETSEAPTFVAAPAESIPPGNPAASVEVPPPAQNAAVDPPALSDPVKQPDTPTADRAQITSPPLVIERLTAFPQVPPRPAEPDVPPPAAEPLQADTPPRPVEPVSDAYVPPQPIRQTKPVVPRNLHTLISREILVEVNLTIDTDGSIVRAEASPGEGPLNRSLARLAVATARLWKFKPAREGNRSVPGEIQIQFQFSPGP